MIKTFRPAAQIIPGTIVAPFLGDARFDVTEIERTAWGSVILRDTFHGREVEMSTENPVEILGAFNLDN